MDYFFLRRGQDVEGDSFEVVGNEGGAQFIPSTGHAVATEFSVHVYESLPQLLTLMSAPRHTCLALAGDRGLLFQLNFLESLAARALLMVEVVEGGGVGVHGGAA